MYQINDLVMYGSIGVCKVTDITKPDFAGSDEEKLYYVLEPVSYTHLDVYKRQVIL